MMVAALPAMKALFREDFSAEAARTEKMSPSSGVGCWGGSLGVLAVRARSG